MKQSGLQTASAIIAKKAVLATTQDDLAAAFDHIILPFKNAMALPDNVESLYSVQFFQHATNFKEVSHPPVFLSQVLDRLTGGLIDWLTGRLTD